MPAAIHKALIYRLVEEGWNEGKLDVIDQMTAPHAVMHDSVLRLHHHHDHHDTPEDGRAAGRRFVTLYRTAFPDLCFKVDEMLAEDDIVVLRWTARGSHGGEMLGIGPTGRLATLRGTSVFRFTQSAIVESWVSLEAESLMQQLSA